MKDEIKEILDDLRKTADNTIFVVCSSQEELDKTPRYTANFMSINDRKAKLLLDYITNIKETKTNMEQELQELYLIKDKLQEENKRLQKNLDFMTDRNNEKQEVIDELEKWCDIQFQVYKDLDKIQDSRISCQYLRMKDKLKEIERR